MFLKIDHIPIPSPNSAPAAVINGFSRMKYSSNFLPPIAPKPMEVARTVPSPANLIIVNLFFCPN